MITPFDALERSKEIERLVMRGNARAYYRFRHANFYSSKGIVTADALGCNLLCAYCWNYKRNEMPQGLGSFFKPSEVALKLRRISEKTDCDMFRISGSEPILGVNSAKHIADIIKNVGGEWVIESNGLILGSQPKLIELFKDLDIFWRVTIKASDPDTFEKVTGAKGEAYKLPMMALETFQNSEHKFQVALNPRLVDADIFADFEDVEYEKMTHYKGVNARLKERGLKEVPAKKAKAKWSPTKCQVQSQPYQGGFSPVDIEDWGASQDIT